MTRDIWIRVACFIAFVITDAVLTAGPVLMTHFPADTATRLPLLAISGIASQ